MVERLFHLAAEYDMTPGEVAAMRLADLYVELAAKYFPDYKHVRFPKRGDPRKCELFKYAWKLYQDTKEKLNPQDYRRYVQAQMSVLKNIRKENWHPLIHPNCLVSKQAWKRWLVWKKYFAEVKKAAEESPIPDDSLVKTALADTQYAIKIRLGDLSKEALVEAMDNQFLFRLAAAGVVSPHFLALSPTVQSHAQEKKLNLGRYGVVPQASDDVKAFYRKLFGDI